MTIQVAWHRAKIKIILNNWLTIDRSLSIKVCLFLKYLFWFDWRQGRYLALSYFHWHIQLFTLINFINSEINKKLTSINKISKNHLLGLEPSPDSRMWRKMHFCVWFLVIERVWVCVCLSNCQDKPPIHSNWDKKDTFFPQPRFPSYLERNTRHSL